MKFQKKNKISLSLKIRSTLSDSLAAGLATEAAFSVEEEILTLNENADSFVDLRARWNTIMRGLIASEQVLKAVDK
mgnify:CR=1 FL=1|jgi:hypothetical protein|tara:strand:+ start:26 stop:253 length:228 start_codon:yes stop_codon:yes gene_type:complete